MSSGVSVGIWSTDAEDSFEERVLLQLANDSGTHSIIMSPDRARALAIDLMIKANQLEEEEWSGTL